MLRFEARNTTSKARVLVALLIDFGGQIMRKMTRQDFYFFFSNSHSSSVFAQRAIHALQRERVQGRVYQFLKDTKKFRYSL